MDYKKRITDEFLKNKLEAFGAALIVGPKGCGKTTTAKQIANTVIEFEDEDNRESLLKVAKTIPSKLLIGDKPILFDEWQDAPKIWGAIRKSIDDTGDVGMYILTGSSSHDVDTPHTGTMRISRLVMLPMSLYESNESNGEASLIDLFNNPNSFNGSNGIFCDLKNSTNFEPLGAYPNRNCLAIVPVIPLLFKYSRA